ncbi:hypothetical protein [Actinocrispum sp. NPDC049592]|uniref:hypothetical protein n=1 Tax=Actinocrispum sp. NPDC049592 TaxID=3154835 RepID=UPI0034464F82
MWLTILAGVVAAVGTLFIPDSLQPEDGTLVFVGGGVGVLLTWPRLWPGMILGAGIGYLVYTDEPTTDRLPLYLLAGALTVGALDLWLRLGQRAWDAVTGLPGKMTRPTTMDILRGAGKQFRRAVSALGDGVTTTLTRSNPGFGVTKDEARQVLRDGQVLLGVIVATLYGASWLAAQWFYGSFGVTPEEVGLTTVDLLLASGITSILVATGILLVDGIWRQVRHPAVRVPLFTVIGALLGAWASGWSGVLIDGAVLGAIGAGTSEWVPAPRPRSRRWVLVVTGFVLVGLLVMAYGTADEVKLNVERDEPATPSLLNIQVAALWAPTVRVWAVEGQNLPPGLPAGDCVHRLGNAYGITVFLRKGQVFRVPTQNVVSATARCERS